MIKLTTTLYTLKKALLLPTAISGLLFAQNSIAMIMPGDLLITEVMANPAAVSDSNGEWFEIWNTSAAALDLNGLILRDDGSNNHQINNPQPILIGAGEYFVLGKKSDSNNNGGYIADYTYSNFSLANSSDEIILEFDGIIINSLSYSNSAIFGIAGISAEQVADSFSLTPSSFTFGAGDIGSPGAAGSANLPIATVPEPGTHWLLAGGIAALSFIRKKR